MVLLLQQRSPPALQGPSSAAACQRCQHVCQHQQSCTHPAQRGLPPLVVSRPVDHHPAAGPAVSGVVGPDGHARDAGGGLRHVDRGLLAGGMLLALAEGAAGRAGVAGSQAALGTEEARHCRQRGHREHTSEQGHDMASAGRQEDCRQTQGTLVHRGSTD